MTSIVRRATAGRLAIAAGIVLISMFAGLPAPTPAHAQCGLPGTPPCPPPKKPTKTPTRRPRTPTPTETATPAPTDTATPTATSIPCDTNVLAATLSGNYEVPSVVTQGMGTVKLLLDVNAGTITGNWEIMLLGGSMTAAHIHDGPAGKNAGVFVPFTGLPGSTGGSFATLNSAPVAKLQDVLNNPPAFYVNVHTMSYPGGEIRGQLACAPAGEPVASPTPTVSPTLVGAAGRLGGSSIPWLSIGLGGLIGGALILVVFGIRRFIGPRPIGSSEKVPEPININRARSHPANHSGQGPTPEPMVGLQPGPAVAPQSIPYWNPPETSGSPSPSDGPTGTPGPVTGPTGSPSTPPSGTPSQSDPEPDEEPLE